MQAKDIPDAVFMRAVTTAAEIRGHEHASRWDVALVLSGFPDLVGMNFWEFIDEEQLIPWKIVVAKARKLIRAGHLRGCYCGCRGDFQVVPGHVAVTFRRDDGTTGSVWYVEGS